MKTQELSILEPDTTESDKKANDSLVKAQALVITTPEEYRQADSYCKGLYNLRKEIEADFAKSLEEADKAKKAATAAKAALVEQIESHTKPVQEAERIFKQKLFAWKKKEDDLRLELQAKQRAEDMKKAEEEKIKKALALEQQGKMAQAAAEIAKPVKIAPVILPPAPTEHESKFSTYWSYEVVNAGDVKREFCKPDPGVIQSSMNAYKKQGKTIEEVQERIGGIVIEEKVK